MREFAKCLYSQMPTEDLYEIADMLIEDVKIDLKAAALHLSDVEWEIQFEKDRRNMWD